MKALKRFLAAWLYERLALGAATARAPDLIVGSRERPYLMRWWLIPRNPVFNVYLHLFLRSDDDRALHDHPWWSVSLMLRGTLREHTIDAGGVHRRRLIHAGNVRVRSSRFAHRLELITPQPAWTIFITGPVMREWGFHCTKGWVPHGDFVTSEDPGVIGLGCDGPSRKPRPMWKLWRGDEA